MYEEDRALPVYSGRRAANWPIVALAALGLVGFVVGGLALAREHRQLDKTRATVESITSAQGTQQRSAAAAGSSLKAARAQLAALAAQLTGAQNQIKSDEQQLKITTAQLPPDVVKLASQVSPSVVLIGCGPGLGTGFAFDLPATAGYQTVVVTAEHVIDDCSAGGPTPGEITVTHEGVNVTAKLRSADSQSDVALIDVMGKIPALAPAPAGPVTGQFVLAVGNPLGITNNVTQGNVSQVDSTDFLNTAPISNGNSGGPLVNSSGQVLGIADAGFAANENAPIVENLNDALRISTLCANLLNGSVCSALH